ncbi:MAG: aspartate aminotransferase family protein [Actinobacteria bacterium]|nr:aspartate aminotransferase family protein [Actinomycetota bacterium]
MRSDEIRARLRELQAMDLPAHGGRTLAYVYDSGLAEADALGLEALAMFSGSNGLDPTAFPSLLAMENDLVSMAGALIDAPAGFVGSVTSGGTESVLLAVLAAREGAGAAPGEASMVLPSTVHAAFHKAAHYFGVETIVVDVDPATFRADPVAMAAAVRDDTVLVVGSAPSYAQGVIDPIPELAAIAAERGLRCHVDACIGGWVLPWLETPIPWTFTVPGVTSISVDLHKYAYAPKGVSLLLHRDPALRRGHFFASADWPGYTMLNSTMQSTKSGGPLAAAWAVTRAIGVEGYAELSRSARDATLAIARGADGIPGLRVVVEPDSTLLALATDGSCDVFTIADEMLARGWYVQPQMAYRGTPATVHLTLSAATAPSVPEFLSALAESVAAARASGPIEVDPGLAAAAAALDPATLSDSDFDGLLALAGLAGGDGALALPERMAPVNALLDVAPAALREALLLAVLDRLSRPSR